MHSGIFLLLGSNLGDREKNLADGRDAIASSVGSIVKASSVYRTAAWGMKEQPDFLNQVVEVESGLSPEQLLAAIAGVESLMGRKRAERWGPRILDIDILFYGQRIIDTARLAIPHPGIAGRRFTLVPLAEVAPGFVHPVLKKSIAVLLQECEDPLAVELLHP